MKDDKTKKLREKNINIKESTGNSFNLLDNIEKRNKIQF
jgi:hypothetical protein